MSDAETLERERHAKVGAPVEDKQMPDSEETFEVNGEYIAEQAREAMRLFFLPLTSVYRAARAKGR